MRVKGRYVATVILDIDYEESGDAAHFDAVKSCVTGGSMTGSIKETIRTISECVFDEPFLGTLTVDQQYADLYKVEE